MASGGDGVEPPIETTDETHADGDQREQRVFFWEALPDMPTGRIYSVAGFNEGKLYVLGNYGIRCVQIKGAFSARDNNSFVAPSRIL